MQYLLEFIMRMLHCVDRHTSSCGAGSSHEMEILFLLLLVSSDIHSSRSIVLMNVNVDNLRPHNKPSNNFMAMLYHSFNHCSD